MTSKVSFKEKLKQISSVLLWDLKGCKGSLIVYTILASVFTVIILTLVLVAMSTDKDAKISEGIQVFQVAASSVIGLLTLVFAIIYTVQIFSYMQNKRKVDFYGSLPISRARLFLAKNAAAYLFSMVPMLFFMGVIAIISICTGTLMEASVVRMYVNFMVGTLACVSAYGFLSACCGTTFNTVIMFVAVCICYPLSMIFVRGYIDAFFIGSYTGDFSNSFIMNALNPISAFFGNNLIYWLIFSVVCVSFGTLLIMKRRSERAQTSFAYYIPCHIIKVIVAFLAGMFLGTIFGAVNVFGNGVIGFVFGFILASAPAFLITHMIFYKGLKQLVKTIPVYAGLAVLVIAGVLLINFDVFGYNRYLPNQNDIKSAGIIATEYYHVPDKSLSRVSSKSAGDFTDAESIKSICSVHNTMVTRYTQKIKSYQKFANVFNSMMRHSVTQVIFGSDYDEAYSIAYKLNNGFTVKRYYSTDLLFTYYYSDSEDFVNEDDSSFYDCINIVKPLISSKTYITKYSCLANASEPEYDSVSVEGYVKGKQSCYESVVRVNNDYDYNGNDKKQNGKNAAKIIAKEINESLLKDIEADEKYLDGVLYNPFAIDEGYYDMLAEVRSAYSDEYVVKINLSFDSIPSSFYSYNNSDEAYYIPKSYKNTIDVLEKYGIINSDCTLNTSSTYFSNERKYDDEYDYGDDYDYYYTE